MILIADKYFYVTDRLVSVRQIIDTSGNVKNRYTYRPFGETYDDEGEVEETITNPFKFTGQYFDSEIDEYYLRARQYDPHIGRFTSRDPVQGNFKEPMTLHKYLYCQNEPINRIDLMGLWYEHIHRSFGVWGGGGLDLFDYARLDFDKPAWKFWKKGYREMHFKSKSEAGQDILTAIGLGDTREFEYAIHGWQDTYTHYDRGHTRWHGRPSIDDLDWSDPADVAAYRACDATTRFFEELFIKSNIEFWVMHLEVELPSSNPWLSVYDAWSSPSKASGYLEPIYKQQMGE